MAGRLVACALLLAAAPAWAARPPQINVIRTEGADPIILEITNRTRAELTAAGLDATIVDCFRGDASCAGVVAATDGTPHAVVMTARDGEGTMTEVKVAAALQDVSPLVLRMAVGAESADRDDPATLAVRAAELVRSALWQAGAPVRASLPAASEEITYDFEQPQETSPVESGVGWFAGAGAALLGTTDGFGTAYGLALRGGYSGLHWPGLAVALSVAAPAFSAGHRFDAGRVTLRQELAAAQASLRFRLGARLQPRMTMGGGIYHLAARGVSDPGSLFVGRSVAIWALMVTAGGGAAFILSDRLGLFVDAQAVFVPDHPELLVGWAQIGGGTPSFLLSTGVERLF